ncbi:MAG: tol-pal system protein YbgF [Desulfovibrionaceae bacterium]|nr:tol-pal system protein YbgF [Desulfovibrionaceae bacterium]
MKKFVQISLVLCAIAGTAAGCVNKNDVEILERRVQEQDMQLRQMQPAQADSWAQVQALQQEINQLKGQVDELQRAGGARNIVNTLQRHDAALRQIETSMALNLGLDAQPANPADAESSAGAPPLTPPSGASTATPVPPTTPPAKAAAPAKDTATALYDAGVASFTARKYAEAQRSFNDFTKNYKSHARIADAHYYVAECYFQQNKFADAALAYDTVITKYGKSAKVPAAYLKQGICFSKMGQNPAAKARMKELIQKYPNSAEAARAKSFLKTNK